MEIVGDGYEAFVERLQKDISGRTKNSGNNNSSNASGQGNSNNISNNFMGYSSPTNAFTVKSEPTLSTISDSSTAGSVSIDVSMQDPVSSPLKKQSPSYNFSMDVNKMPDFPPRRGTHRRAQSEVAFRLPDDIEIGLAGFDLPTPSDDITEELFSMYMEMEKNNSFGDGGGLKGSVNEGNTKSTDTGGPHHSRSLSVDDDALWGLKDKTDSGSGAGSSGIKVFSVQGRPRHRHSNSMDGSTSLQSDPVFSEALELKKTMAADKLAESPTSLHLEKRSRNHRDAAGLTTENKELKLRLQAMEQHAQLRDALNEALGEEVQRLKIATGQLPANNRNVFSIGVQPNQSFFSLPQQAPHLTTQQLDLLQQFQQHPSTFNNQEFLAQSQVHSDFFEHGSLGTMQGHGGSQGGHFEEAQVSSIAVSQSSSTSF